MHHSRLARLALASAVAVSPVAIGAQAQVERPATHTVERNDTLWDLAQQYLADPFQWPQIYQLNKELIKDPHWIYPGQVLRIPGGEVMPVAPASAPQTATAATTGRGSQTGTSGMTVFNPARRRAVEQQTRASLISQSPRAAVRTGDYEASPYLWDVGAHADSGSVLGTAESVATSMTVQYRPIGYREHLVITIPRGVTPAVKQKFLTYRVGPLILGQGQVVIPTGVVEISAILDANRADGVLVSKFENVFAGQGVTAYESLNMPLNVHPTRVEFGLSTRVLWIYAAPELVSEGRHIILAGSAAQGFAPGDQVSLRVPSKVDPTKDDEIGVAQVTRVTKWGTSAIMLDVTDGGILVGTRGQVSAKMP